MITIPINELEVGDTVYLKSLEPHVVTNIERTSATIKVTMCKVMTYTNTDYVMVEDREVC